LIKPKAAIVLFGQEPFSSFLRISNLEMFKYDWYWEKERLTNIHQVKKRAGKVIETVSVFYDKQCTYNPQMQTYHGERRTNKVKNGVIGGLSDSNKNKVHEYKDNGTRYPTQLLKFKRDILTSNLHPTQKPVKLLKQLIEIFTDENDTVIDPCAGSGTTLKACMELNRNCYGFELHKDFYNRAVNEMLIEEKQQENKLFQLKEV
jgi:site-specific DNA-methyltransferase (adenine-specific)